MAKAKRGYESITYTSGRALAKEMGLRVTAEPEKNFVVCMCKARHP